MPFSVHVDQKELAVRDLAAGLARPSTEATASERRDASGAGRRGGRDDRQAARGQSGRDHARAGGGKSRSYAFRRS
ncbi:hypothetical protein ODJ79_23080 [Actinoplanes sp. KI2]|uniref:hypothetical protein n=1 Tax=Actinoplanes sp. KI2 TaxID=2983315 RepID=UPI0021D5FDFD|nr:hypothetical protein [Actinoplanes sp. KI2]MCU7726626.1 hypothetical protein [Actinoplanes sp. KI2]